MENFYDHGWILHQKYIISGKFHVIQSITYCEIMKKRFSSGLKIYKTGRSKTSISPYLFIQMSSNLSWIIFLNSTTTYIEINNIQDSWFTTLIELTWNHPYASNTSGLGICVSSSHGNYQVVLRRRTHNQHRRIIYDVIA